MPCFGMILLLKGEIFLPAFYEALTHKDPSFPVIFHLDFLSGAQGGAEAAHWHEGIELLYCIEGAAIVMADREPCRMTPGTLAMISSGSVHYISPDAPEGCRYYCLIVEPALLAESSFSFQTVRLERRTDDPLALVHFRRLVEEMAAKDKYYKEAVRGEIYLLFTSLYRYHSLPGSLSQGSRQDDAVKSAILYLRAHFREKLTVDAVCRHVGFSKYYFCRMFKESTGRSVLEYIHYLRCAAARNLLETGKYNISESARLSGFPDVSYFTKVFKKQMGILPSQVGREGGTSPQDTSRNW